MVMRSLRSPRITPPSMQTPSMLSDEKAAPAAGFGVQPGSGRPAHRRGSIQQSHEVNIMAFDIICQSCTIWEPFFLIPPLNSVRAAHFVPDLHEYGIMS